MSIGKWLGAGLAMGLAAATAMAQETPPAPAVIKLLKAAGAVSYAQKAPYGGGIAAICLGYDQDGVAVAGVATRQTKTYREAMTMVSVVPAPDGKFQVAVAEIPEIGQFHGKSQDYARQALNDVKGRVFADEAEARGLVDAITGATKYKQAIYVSCSLMAARLIAELKEKPQWERRPLPAE